MWASDSSNSTMTAGQSCMWNNNIYVHVYFLGYIPPPSCYLRLSGCNRIVYTQTTLSEGMLSKGVAILLRKHSGVPTIKSQGTILFRFCLCRFVRRSSTAVYSSTSVFYGRIGYFCSWIIFCSIWRNGVSSFVKLRCSIVIALWFLVKTIKNSKQSKSIR